MEHYFSFSSVFGHFVLNNIYISYFMICMNILFALELFFLKLVITQQQSVQIFILHLN